MSQVIDRTVGANHSGFDMRTELNNIIAALESDNSGSSEPSNPVAGMKWMDTSDATYYYYKERNHDNTAWVTLFRYTVATKIMEVVSNGVVLQDSALVHATGDETIAGIKTFSSSPIVPVPTLANQVISMGNIIEKTGVKIGYGNGSGGTVTQLTSKSTAVTLNKPTGQIIMNNSDLAGAFGSNATFRLNNNLISPGDLLFTSVIGGSSTTNRYYTNSYCQTSTADITVRQDTGATLSEAVVVAYVLIKGVNS